MGKLHLIRSGLGVHKGQTLYRSLPRTYFVFIFIAAPTECLEHFQLIACASESAAEIGC